MTAPRSHVRLTVLNEHADEVRKMIGPFGQSQENCGSPSDNQEMEKTCTTFYLGELRYGESRLHAKLQALGIPGIEEREGNEPEIRSGTRYWIFTETGEMQEAIVLDTDHYVDARMLLCKAQAGEDLIAYLRAEVENCRIPALTPNQVDYGKTYRARRMAGLL